MSTKVTTFALVKTKHVLDIGEMAEWSIAAVLKTVVPVRVPGVRIPLPPLRKEPSWVTTALFFGQSSP